MRSEKVVCNINHEEDRGAELWLIEGDELITLSVQEYDGQTQSIELTPSEAAKLMVALGAAVHLCGKPEY